MNGLITMEEKKHGTTFDQLHSLEDKVIFVTEISRRNKLKEIVENCLDDEIEKEAIQRKDDDVSYVSLTDLTSFVQSGKVEVELDEILQAIKNDTLDADS
ncbi:hypothetical protein DH09_00675 (plasmid) [Bacillaceae bacterium JMAK1]|nr:hypothetical protein DH09_00675 [Bacillaceae bacterium JMAK1]